MPRCAPVWSAITPVTVSLVSVMLLLPWMKMPLPAALPEPAIDPPVALNVPPWATNTAPPAGVPPLRAVLAEADLRWRKPTHPRRHTARRRRRACPPVPPGAVMATSDRSEKVTEPLLTMKPRLPPPSIVAERLVLSGLSPMMVSVSPAARLIAGNVGVSDRSVAIWMT